MKDWWLCSNVTIKLNYYWGGGGIQKKKYPASSEIRNFYELPRVLHSDRKAPDASLYYYRPWSQVHPELSTSFHFFIFVCLYNNVVDVLD